MMQNTLSHLNVLSQPQLQLDLRAQILQEAGTAVSACHTHRCHLDCLVGTSVPLEITPFLSVRIEYDKNQNPPQELRQGTGRRLSARICKIWAGCLAHSRV